MSSSITSRTTVSGPASGTHLVISLDLGTAFSGASWALLSPGQDPHIWDVDGFRQDTPFTKIPTVLYYDLEGKLRAAGSETLVKQTIEEASVQKWTLVKWFKLLLCPDSLAHQLGNSPHVEMPRNKKLVTVMADFLRYMVDLASQHFLQTMDGEEKNWEEMKSRVTYILSYSNGWNTFQHSLMRDAAIRAGIVPNSDEGKHRIKFVSEGEASLHWCIENRVGLKHLSVGSQFIVVDAGGGTIDISSFKCVGTEPLKFEESSIPESHLQGSAFVSQAFREYVQAKLKDSTFGAPEIIERIVENFDQLPMQTFKDRNELTWVKFGQDQDHDPRFGINVGKLLVQGEQMARFYESACNAIVASMKAKIVPNGETIVVLVGGFARNQYVFKEVQRRLRESRPQIRILRPTAEKVKPSARGIICFYLHRAVRARMATGTYGVSCIHEFDPKHPKHIQRKSRVQNNPVTGQQYIEGGFFVTLKKGTVIQETELTRFPFWYSQPEPTAVTLNIALECYRGDVADIMFRDEDRDENFQELCWFKAVIPETSLARGTKKNGKWLEPPQHYYIGNFRIIFTFGATEFECYIEWTDNKGMTQKEPAIPIWNDELSIMSNVHNNQEKAPDVEQQHSAPSLLSTMKLSDGPDRSVSESKIGVLDLASVSPRPWERDSKGPQFMHSHRVAASNFVGAFNDWIVSASPGVLLFTLPSEVIMFNTERKTIRRLSYGFRVKSTSAAHNLSPDGNTLVRWILNETNQTSTLMAIDVSSKKQIAELQRSHRFQQSDILNAIWIDDSTIYIPISAEGIIIPWNIRGATPQTKDLEVIEPLPSITCHSILKFEITKNRSWWTATGITFDPPSSFIEVHDVEHDESRVVDGMVSCVTEVEVNGKEKALLASAGVTQDFKLQLCVQQLDLRDTTQHFTPIDVKIETIEEKDYPRDIMVLHPLQIVAVMTEKFHSYFFELNTGAYLYSQAQKSYRFCPGQSDQRELLIWSHEKSDVQVLTINQGDLIGYCRKVLKDDGLASAIARRTGLSEGEDMIPDTM